MLDVRNVKFAALAGCFCFVSTLFFTSTGYSVGNTLATSTKRYSKTGVSSILINLNPNVNRWFMLYLKKGYRKQFLHLENTDPKNKLSLGETGIIVQTPEEDISIECHFWKRGHKDNLLGKSFKKHINPFKPVCDHLIYLRLRRDSKTKLSTTEWGTALLRKNRYGEAIINAFKPFLVSLKAESSESKKAKYPTGFVPDSAKYPKVPIMTSSGKTEATTDHSLGIPLRAEPKEIAYGRWYESKSHDNIYVSLFKTGHIAKSILDSYPKRVDPLDEVEVDKLSYVMAYDLEKYTTNFVMGTTHPNIGKSPLKIRGFSNINNYLVPIGSIPPHRIKDSVGVFIGGWKSRHGRFYRGPYKGKVYGYMESGVELQKLKSGLATFYTTLKGDLELGKWPSDPFAAKELLGQISSARQNGVLIVENGIPTNWVNKKIGNWSGDAKGNLRSLRSGLCMQERDDKKFLLFFAITAATPSTVARIMQAYQCKNGMGLDMNQYVYMHNTLFTVDKNQKVAVEYLHEEMEYPKGIKYPRYIMDNNERDFFYIEKKKKVNDHNIRVTTN